MTMPIIDQNKWNGWVKNNKDPYGKACVDVARRSMEILDDVGPEFKADDIITAADKSVDTGGITGFMAGCVAQMISGCHSRGGEFRKKWNKEYGIEEKDDKGGIVNPAILTIREGRKDHD